VFGPLIRSSTPNQPIDDGLIARLELADRTMRETLRLHPAGVGAPREAAVDVPEDIDAARDEDASYGGHYDKD